MGGKDGCRTGNWSPMGNVQGRGCPRSSGQHLSSLCYLNFEMEFMVVMAV